MSAISRSDAVKTPIGRVPRADALDLSGLDISFADVEAALRVDPDEWRAEIPLIEEWFASFGDRLPGELWAELDALKARLGMDEGSVEGVE